MLEELESHSLVVVLAPSKRADRRDWDHIRVCADVPPRWYRRLCGHHPSSRGVRRGKFDTCVRRQNILRVLRRLAEGKPSKSKYVEDLSAVARKIEATPF